MLTEAELRQYRCCFTGHRPEKLSRIRLFIKWELNKEIVNSINAGFNVFVSGMSRGTDLLAADLVLKLKKKYKNIKLICAIPYVGFEQKWSLKTQKRYHRILEKADFVKIINKSFTQSAYQTRNEWMVNHSNKVIAVFGGKLGGTNNTIVYAINQNIPVTIIRG